MPRFNFGRLVRFKNPAGKIYYGEVEGEFFAAEDLIGRNVPVYTGVNPWDNDFHRSYHREPISEVRLLCSVHLMKGNQQAHR
jgi:hypothetical protein